LVASPHDQREQDELHEDEAGKVAAWQSVHPYAQQDATERFEIG
jgi:cation transport regulator ChaB